MTEIMGYRGSADNITPSACYPTRQRNAALGGALLSTTKVRLLSVQYDKLSGYDSIINIAPH
jgi:hypothetical protein